MSLVISLREKGGPVENHSFDKDEIYIGRVRDNDIVLAKNNISKKHACIRYEQGRLMLIDLKSTNGSYINGRRIEEPYELRDGDKIHIGDFTLEIDTLANDDDESPPEIKPFESTSLPVSTPVLESQNTAHLSVQETPGTDTVEEEDWGVSSGFPEDLEPAPVHVKPHVVEEMHTVESAPVPVLAAPAQVQVPLFTDWDEHAADPHVQLYRLMRFVYKELGLQIDLTQLGLFQNHALETKKKVYTLLGDILSKRVAAHVVDQIDQEDFKQTLLQEIFDFGPLTELLDEEDVSDILVNGPNQIFVERFGYRQPHDHVFMSEESLKSITNRLVQETGHVLDEQNPVIDARLANGLYVNAIVPPLSMSGTCLTLRRQKQASVSMSELVGRGTLSAQMAEFLGYAVRLKQSLLVVGTHGSGKTTTLNALCDLIPDFERTLSIEEIAEFKMNKPHWIALETRPANMQGQGAITLRDLVKIAQRMRPDRMIVGECKGAEMFDVVQAMNAEYRGLMTTIHAHSIKNAIHRIETLMLMSGIELPQRVIREQIAQAFSLVIEQTRLSDGTRRIVRIAEIAELTDQGCVFKDIYVFEQKGTDQEGKVRGVFRSTGYVPQFIEEAKSMLFDVDESIFQAL